MNRYFDRLFYFQELYAHQDEYGNWIKPHEEGAWVDKGDCRIEFQAEGVKMVGNDKQFHNVSAIIQCPLSLVDLPADGQRIKVVRKYGEEIEVNTINAARGLLHARIWVE